MAVVTIQQSVAALYVAVFNRAPDAAGLNAWTAVITSGQQTFAQVAAGFAAHEVFTAGIGTLSNTDFVAALYQNILGSAGDAGGIANWSDQLNAGMSKADVAALFVQAALTVDIPAMLAAGSLTAAEAAAATVRQQTLTNKADVGIYFANTLGAASNLNPNTVSSSKAGLEADPIYNASKAAIANVTDSPASVAAAEDAIAVAAGSSNPAQALLGGTFTLTASQDALVGTAANDVFNALAVVDASGNLHDSLQGVDSINGGAGNDTLNVTLNDGVKQTPALSNVENVVLRTTNAASKLDLSASTGVTSVTIANSSSTGEVDAVGAASLAVKNQIASVKFDGSTATALNLTLDTVGTATASTVVDLGVVTAAKATSAAITANNAYVDINSTAADALTSATIAATGTNAIKFTDSATTLTSLTVTGTGSVDVSGVALTKVTTLTAGDGGVKADFTGGVLATATTGAGNDTLTAVGATVKTITTGAGNDTLNIVTNALAATSVVDLGAGDDTVNLGAVPSAANAGFTLTGGAGTDTIGLLADDYTTVSGYSAANLAKITGFEVLSITDAAGLAGASTTDLSKLAGLTSVAFNGVVTATSATISNVGANATVSEGGDLVTNNGTAVISLKDATGASDTVNLNLNLTNALAAASSTDVASSITVDGVENVNVNTSVTSTTAGVTDAKAVYTLSITNTDTALTNLVLKGSQAVSFTSDAAFTKLATVDASGLTAGATIDVSNAASTSAAVTVTGSAKADVITVANNALVTGGAGNDTFKIAATTSGQTYSTITDASTGDVLSFGVGAAGFTAAKLNLASTAVFQDYLDSATAGNATKGVSWFQFSGNTYVVEDNNAATTFQNGADTVVKLAGLVDLSHATFAAGNITLA